VNQTREEIRIAQTSIVSAGPPRVFGEKKTVLTLFGTRPEIIKLAPVIRGLERENESIRTINVNSGQHLDLLYSLIDLFGVRVDFDLRLMTPNQDHAALCGRIAEELYKIVDTREPELILVQGDTTTALAGALVGHERRIPVAHVEAGLRSGNILSPCPEEMNRRLITRLATYHFASTVKNRDTLLQEGVQEKAIFVTGNPVVDALQMILRSSKPHCPSGLLSQIENHKCILLTTHRRESFGGILAKNLQILRQFIEEHEDLILVFPVHPNPNVKRAASEILSDHPRIVIIPPLQYGDFIQIVSKSWLIVSDSGGIQEEVPSLGKPLLILRENTERPECIEAGIARLVGNSPKVLMALLQEAYQPDSWVYSIDKVPNPFGRGDSAERIVRCVSSLLEDKPAA
jgi:UDP-N-acetylglucosamine 2-epimerase (non-hydrolysing)